MLRKKFYVRRDIFYVRRDIFYVASPFSRPPDPPGKVPECRLQRSRLAMMTHRLIFPSQKGSLTVAVPTRQPSTRHLRIGKCLAGTATHLRLTEKTICFPTAFSPIPTTNVLFINTFHPQMALNTGMRRIGERYPLEKQQYGARLLTRA